MLVGKFLAVDVFAALLRPRSLERSDVTGRAGIVVRRTGRTPGAGEERKRLFRATKHKWAMRPPHPAAVSSPSGHPPGMWRHDLRAIGGCGAVQLPFVHPVSTEVALGVALGRGHEKVTDPPKATIISRYQPNGRSRENPVQRHWRSRTDTTGSTVDGSSSCDRRVSRPSFVRRCKWPSEPADVPR